MAKRRRKKKKLESDKLIPLATALIGLVTSIINLIVILTR